MQDKLKALGVVVLGVVIFLAVLALPVVFIMGSLWASTHLLKPLIAIGWIMLAIDVVIFLPLSAIRPLRRIMGTLIFVTSFLFGLITWLIAFIVTYILWGLFAVIIGFVIFGGGIVPIALLATLIHGEWGTFFAILVLIGITFGSRLVGFALVESYENGLLLAD